MHTNTKVTGTKADPEDLPKTAVQTGDSQVAVIKFSPLSELASVCKSSGPMEQQEKTRGDAEISLSLGLAASSG